MKPMRKQKAEPGYEGKMELQASTVVSPYLNAEVKGQQTEKVMRNVRHDILEFEFSRRHIDAQQKANGDWFLEQCEQAIVGGAKALDYAKAKVDTSFKPYSVPDTVLSAIDSLEGVERSLGHANYNLLVETIFLGRLLKDAAFDRYGPYRTEYARRDSEAFIGRLWRELLTKMRDAPDKKAKPMDGPGGWRGRHVPLNGGATG